MVLWSCCYDVKAEEFSICFGQNLTFLKFIKRNVFNLCDKMSRNIYFYLYTLGRCLKNSVLRENGNLQFVCVKIIQMGELFRYNVTVTWRKVQFWSHMTKGPILKSSSHTVWHASNQSQHSQGTNSRTTSAIRHGFYQGDCPHICGLVSNFKLSVLNPLSAFCRSTFSSWEILH